MSADEAATRLIKRALATLLQEVKAEKKLGLQSRALPTEDKGGLAATVTALRAALQELGEPASLAVVGRRTTRSARASPSSWPTPASSAPSPGGPRATSCPCWA